MEYQPKFGRVIIKRETIKDKIGSIYIPDQLKDKHKNVSCVGVIYALGETAGWIEHPTQGMIQTMKIGDKVIFGRHSGAWLDATYGANGENDDGSLFICKDEDILAVIQENKLREVA